MEITYHWEGDYLIPDLKLSDTMDYHVGRYGRMRQKYLKENHRGVYSYMLLTETLWKHLAEIDEECRANAVRSGMYGQDCKTDGKKGGRDGAAKI